MHSAVSFIIYLPSTARCPQTPAYSPAPCVCTSRRCIHCLFVPVRCIAGFWSIMATCPLWHTHHMAIESTFNWERVSHQIHIPVLKNLVVILYLSFAVFIHKNIHKWKIVYGKITKWWIQTSANIWWLMSQMSHFPSCFYQTFALGQLPFLNFLLLCLHITDPNLPAVCQLQSMFISRNYMTSDLQPQEVHGCAHLNVGGASPEVHVIKLHSSGSGLCGWEQATTWCPGKSRN